MNIQPPTARFLSRLALAASCLVGGQAFAVNYYSYGNNGSFLNVAAEYSNTDGSTVNATATPNSATSDLFFLNSTVGSSGALTFYTGNSSLRFNSMTFRSNVGSIQFDRNTMAAPTTTASILMRGGGITMDAGAGPVTWGGTDQRVVLGAEANFTIANNSSSDLTFNREVQSVTNNTTFTITVDGSGSGNTIFYDVKTNSSGRETAMTINTSGSGIVKFVGNNTYLGATTINAGTLQLGDGGTAGALAAGSAITNNGTLVFNRSDAIAQGTDFASVIAGTGNLIQAGTGNLTLSGNNTYTGTTTISAGTLALGGNQSLGAIAGSGNISLSTYNLNATSTSSTTFSGVMSGSGAFTKGGAGTLTVSGANTYTGSTTISAGTIQIGNDNGLGSGGNITFSGGGLKYGTGITADLSSRIKNSGSAILLDTTGETVTWATALDSTNSGGFTKNGAGTLTIDSLSAYTGATAINGGKLVINNTVTATNWTPGAIAINNASTLEFTGGQTILEDGDTMTFDSAGGGAILTTNSVIWRNADIITTGGLKNTVSGVGIFNGQSAVSNRMVDYTVADGSDAVDLEVSVNHSNVGLTKSGAGTLALLNTSNTMSVGITINAGTLEIGGGGRLQSGSYSQNITNNGTFSYNSTAAQTLSGTISGTGGLIKNASSTLTLTGNNTYTGTTTVSAGMLTLSNAALNNQTIQGNININGGTLNLGASHQIADSSDITLSSGSMAVSNRSESINAISMSSGNLTISTGVLTLGAAGSLSNFTGGIVTITGTSGRINTYGTTTLGNATFDYSNASGTGTNGLALNGDIEVNANATANFTTSGGLAGRIILMDANRVFDIGSGANMNVGWRIRSVTDSLGALTKNGSGTLTLTASNPYGNGTTINDGTLVLGTATDTLANAGAVTINGGTLSIGANSDTVGTITLAGGEITGTSGVLTGASYALQSGNVTAILGGSSIAATKTTGGTVILSGANTYTGATTINAGTLSISSIGNGGAASNIGQSTSAAGNLTLGGGTLEYTGSTASTDRNFTLTASTTSTINVTQSGTSLTISGAAASTNGSLTKVGSGTLILSGNNSYTGTTTIDAGTLEITTTGLLGGGSYAGNIVNTGAFIIGSNSNQTLSGAISGIGALTKNGTGTLTLAGNNNYSGGTMLNTGTLVIGHSAAAGTGTITQASSSSLLKFDTTGTITNAMSVYNVLASQSATLSGAITVNNATWDIDSGDTLTISGAVSGNGGVTKNGGGTLILSGNNTYLAPTVINAGTLEAAHAGALGSNNTVQVTGGTLLVTADDAINGKNIQMGGSGIGLQFSGNYSGAIGNLTLSANSIIDLGTGSVQILFQGLTSSNHTLSFYNWSGTTLWNGGNGTTDTDKVYFGPDLSDEALAKIYFHSGAVGVGDSFLGSGFDLGLKATGFTPAMGHQIIPVPEPETYAAGLLLLLGGAWWMWRNRKSEACSHGTPLPCGVKGNTLK